MSDNITAYVPSAVNTQGQYNTHEYMHEERKVIGAGQRAANCKLQDVSTDGPAGANSHLCRTDS